MPIYEYRCGACGRRNSLYFQTFAAAEGSAHRCESCGSDRLERLVSRVAVVKSEESRLDEMSDPSSFGDVDENDPRSVARWARRMGESMGEDLGDEFSEMVDRLEGGEMPEDDGGGEDLGGNSEDW